MGMKQEHAVRIGLGELAMTVSLRPLRQPTGSRRDRGGVSAEPGEPSAAVVRTADGRLGYLHAVTRAAEGDDGPFVHGLLLSVLHATHSMPLQPCAPPDTAALGAEQMQWLVERVLKGAAALPGKLDVACAAAAKVQRGAAVGGLPQVVRELRECLLAMQQSARSRAVGRGLDKVLAALDGQSELD
ncbi:hypothetical protein WJX81_003575 [Elliptochloris bilobata]|uniref:Uncharacterized protein n=1 Tax=Elliptochloris bilobata TaxID=381761 RepID=A0AAW1RBL4_9CHLO